MEASQFIRVVALRKGKVRVAEFMLRPKETGLSLFAVGGALNSEEIIDAVRAAGKQGELTAAVILKRDLDAMGLKLIQTAGGTPSPEINAVHVEARLSILLRLTLWVRGIAIHEYFNENLSRKLYAIARVLD